MKTAKIAALTIFLVLLVEFLALEIFLRTHSFSARDKPSWIEESFAEHARNISTPGDARELKNPNQFTEESRAEAREHWVMHCSACHGIDGRGDTTFGKNMYSPAPNVTESETQQKTDGELFYIISNGVRLTGMPAFGGEDSPESIWDLVAFIRHLPQLSPDELKQMEELAAEGSIEETQESDKQSEKKGSEGKSKNKTAKPHTHKPGSRPHEHR